MNKKVKVLLERAIRSEDELALQSLKDLGLLVEYKITNNNSSIELMEESSLADVVLDDVDIISLVSFFYYHIINLRFFPVTVAWCLGKCGNFNDIEGMKLLFNHYSNNDDVCEQLLFSISTLTSDITIIKELINWLEENIMIESLPKVSSYVDDFKELVEPDSADL